MNLLDNTTCPGRCYCSCIQEKYEHISNKLQEYAHNGSQPAVTTSNLPYNEINHVCSLKGTHTLNSYFSSKIKALPGSEEERCVDTMNINQIVPKSIDSVEIGQFYAQEMTKLLPSMFDLYTLAVNTKKIQDRESFAKWYQDWKYYCELKKENEVNTSLANDDYILQEEEQRETFTLRDSKTGTCIEVTIENYVYSTHFKNEYTNAPYKFNLSYLAQKFLPKGVTFIKTKFAKIDFRTPWGSQLIFESGGMIETGAKQRTTSKKLLIHTLNFLRNECGYKNIAISKRICQNVVMTGKTNHNICLNLLSSKYPFVTYYPNIFAGAMIRIEELDKYYQMTSNEAFDDFEEDDDDEFEVNPTDEDDIYVENDESNQQRHVKKMHVKQEENAPVLEEEEEEVELDDDDEQEEGLLFDEDIDDTIIKNTDALYYDYLNAVNTTSHNKKNNATILLFEQGALICVGNKSRKKAKQALLKIRPILESCRDSPENLAQEKILAALSSSANSTLSSLTRERKKKRKAVNDGTSDSTTEKKQKKIKK